MKKLLMLLFVAAMCIPSYGVNGATYSDIIVYKFTRTFDPWIDFSDSTQVLATNVGTRQLTGYLVLNVDANTTWALNADPCVILYSSGTGSDKWGISFAVSKDVTDANGSMDVNLFNLTTNKGLLFVIDANTEEELAGASYSTVYGKTGLVDIGKGTGNKKAVPSSMKGIVEEWAETVDSFEALGNTTMTLNSLYTQWANKTGAVKTQKQTVDKIITDLGNLGYPFEGTLQARIDAAFVGRAAAHYPPKTITVTAGTYRESIHIDEPNVTLKSASGKASTIIDPGADYRQALKISGEHVTIDGFTIKHGTQAFSTAHPQEHTIWVDANYSTIKNCTIIGATGGAQASLFIGGRLPDVEHSKGTSIYDYNDGTPSKGHIIQDNTFRYRLAGEGWGIFAVKLTDGCLIHGNTFYGDAANVGHFDHADRGEGAPGSGIVIHSAAKGGSTYGVTIEYNTAKYVKYSFVTFTASFPYVMADGFLQEMPGDSEVNNVLVRYNTVHDNGKDPLHANGVAVTFAGLYKGYVSGVWAYNPCSADLTIGTGKVKIEHNTFYATGNGVYIWKPQPYPAGDPVTYGCVLQADNITITNNSIYGNTTRGASAFGYGVYNGTIEANQDDDDHTIDASSNWWGDATGPYNATANPYAYGNQVSNSVTYSPYWTNATMTTHAH